MFIGQDGACLQRLSIFDCTVMMGACRLARASLLAMKYQGGEQQNRCCVTYSSKRSEVDLMDHAAKEYDMHDPSTRRRVFWLLKRLTSFSLWAKKRDAWEVFARAYENAVRTWPKNAAERVDADLLPRIYETLSSYTKGVEELGKGHRFVWRTGQALEAALDTSGTVHNFLYAHPDYWEHGTQTAPYPDNVEALNRLLLASTYEGDYAPIEVPVGPQKSARYSSPGALLDPERYTYRFYQLAYPVFPAEIPEVPGGTDLIISSGQRVPVDGIWEPVSIGREKALDVLPLGIRSVENNGCFNYLVSDTKAPSIMGQWSGVNSRTTRTTTRWRLLWGDTRYKDGVIPDETEYFLEPMNIDSATATQSVKGLEARTGDVCPVSGT
ncbi:Imm72 family immunity protein [Paraburkholderia sp. A1RI_3L]|uniref:Imm72 family immunity protein n=2 Tax=Paraburkholderia TaxID=1822464 RepID=UPI003B7D1555